jgi:hypothetical protein
MRLWSQWVTKGHKGHKESRRIVTVSLGTIGPMDVAKSPFAAYYSGSTTKISTVNL